MPSLTHSPSPGNDAVGPASSEEARPDTCGERAGGSVGARKDGATRQPLYWRSVDDFADSPEFQELVDREFPSTATELVTPDDRRQFIKVMGASFALAGLAMGGSGCRRWPDVHVAPYASRPQNRTPGQTVQYATMMELDGCATALLATSFDGRPIKLDGNPQHPTSGGGSDAFSQAAILGLYDQDRSREVFHDGAASDFHAFAAFAGEHFRSLGAAKGAGLAILSESSSSPTMRRLRDELAKAMPAATWTEWSPVNHDNERLGTAMAFGAPQRVQLSFQSGSAADAKAAKVVLSLDADFLRDHPAAVRHAREFARTRRVALGDAAQAKAKMSRLYMLDSGGTITGVVADERLPMRACDVAPIAAMIAQQVLDALGGGAGGLSAAIGRLAGVPSAAKALDAHGRESIKSLVADLVANKSASVVVAGRQQPPEVHAIAALLNERLGNVGKTVSYVPDPDPKRPSCVEQLRQLRDAIAGGGVTTLVVLGGNPAYDAPADIDIGAAIKKIKNSVHLGVYRDETARLCAWHLPRAHFIEAWGDGRGHDGTYTLAQPLIAPMIEPGMGGVSSLEFVSALLDWGKGAMPAMIAKPDPAAHAPAADAHGSGHAAGAAPTRHARPDGIHANQLVGQELVKATFAAMTGTSGIELDRRWRALVHDGFLDGSAAAAGDAGAKVVGDDLAKSIDALAASAATIKPDALEVVFRPDAKVFDGRFGNNGWLQELPEPVTKVAWDNAAVMSLGTAQALGVARNDLIKLEVGGKSLDMAVFPLPGHPDNSIWVTLGYGRGPDAGRLADAAGFNTYTLRQSSAMSIAPNAKASKIAGHYTLASTQDKGAGNAVADAGIQDRLPTLVREASVVEWEHHPEFAKHPEGYHVAHRLSLWEESNLDGAKHRWAMSVDLSTCIGCSACVVACQAENNIPVVGKEQVRRGREMQWIRIDRYFKGADPAHPDATFFQPVTCLHCENAPCEQVCPVAATVHDEDGLNVMVYNRCVGTRYCSNNCPYKVRRFNYFDWHRKDPTRGNDWLQTQPDYFFREGPDRWKQMQFNPEVTVRMRGIMEKCTFCTQRITKAKIDAKNAWAKAGGRDSGKSDFSIPDGAITPACAQACPSEAIVFGDLNDPKSRVAQLHKSKLSYDLLEELNTKPRLKYLARVGNPAHEHHDGHDDKHAPAGAHA